jgi:phosphohistidine phosphatase
VSPARGRGKPAGRRLLLLRHAKAEREPQVDDPERPLAPRGRRDAGRMGRRIAELGLAPEQVLCSPARRARETLDRVLPHLPEGLAVVFDRGLYLAPPEGILARIAAVDDRVRTLLVVGHNPGLAELAEQLAQGGDAELLERLRHKFPTCGVAAIESPALRWCDLAAGGGILFAFLTPREVAGAGA